MNSTFYEFINVEWEKTKKQSLENLNYYMNLSLKAEIASKLDLLCQAIELMSSDFR